MHLVQPDVRVRRQQSRRNSPPEVESLVRPLGITESMHGDEYGLRQPRHLQCGGQVGQRTVACSYEHGWVLTVWVRVSEPRRDCGEVDTSKVIRIDALGAANACVDLAEDRPRQLAGHPNADTLDSRATEIGEGTLFERRHRRRVQDARGVE